MRYSDYPLLPETELNGFVFGAITPFDPTAETGAGYLQGPDGSCAGVQWELSEDPYIMRIASPDQEGWGIYRVGFTRPVAGAAHVRANLEPLITRLTILYQRARRY